MFSNFLYFLVALIVYTTADFFQTDQPVGLVSFVNTALVGFVFFITCQMVFRQIAGKNQNSSLEKMDYYLNRAIRGLSILAILFFCVVVYGFKPQQAFSDVAFLNAFPTVLSVVFISVFLSFLVMVWNAAYPIQRQFFSGTLTKKEYIISNISFSLPALLPWFVISMIADILVLLPWAPVKQFLQSPVGEITYVAVFLVAITLFGPLLIKRLWHCRPLEPGYARQRIERICEKAGIEYNDILLWELFGGTMITAGVMGLISRFRYILVTPALFNALDENELDAVMIHEIGHVQKYHMVFYLLFFAGFIACNFMLFEPLMKLLIVVSPAYQMFDLVGIDRGTAYPLMIAVVLVGLFILYFRGVFGYIMRNFERQADLHIYQFTPDASALISTFYKIASFSRQSIDKPSWHHFSIGQRVRFLEKCQQFPSLIQQHHTRVKRLIAGYLLLTAAVLYAGYSLSYGSAKPMFDEYITEKILFMQMEIEPDNADLYVLVGDYYYDKKEYQKAIEAYENVLLVDPENVHALNNLSWLFATCPDKTFQDSQSALIHAKKALHQNREAFVLDTYAEALFVNNDIEKAVKIAREALRVSKTRKAYYQSQVTRFENRLAQQNT